MDHRQHWMELARMLEAEWRGEGINPAKACELANTLLPHHPEMRHTLDSVRNRMART